MVGDGVAYKCHHCPPPHSCATPPVPGVINFIELAANSSNLETKKYRWSHLLLVSTGLEAFQSTIYFDQWLRIEVPDHQVGRQCKTNHMPLQKEANLMRNSHKYMSALKKEPWPFNDFLDEHVFKEYVMNL